MKMNYSKILWAVATLPLLVAGCDSDDQGRINTSGVSVGFGESVLSVKETVDFITIPIVVGDDAPRNGDVIVTVTMTGTNADFELDKDIIITTETLRIPPELDAIDFEVVLNVDNPEMVTGRNVEFTITSAKGASIGADKTCRLDIIERNFVEGLYQIEGISMTLGSKAYANVRITTLDETLDDVRLDFGIGSRVVVDFTEVTPQKEYDVRIEPFQFIGSYNSYNVYVTWMSDKNNDDDPDTVESYLGYYYDRTRPVKGKFTRTVDEDGEEFLQFKMEDGFGLLGLLESRYNWFDNFEPNATITKID